MTTTIEPGNHNARATRWAWDTTKDGAMCLAILFRLDESGQEIDGRLYFDTERVDTRGRTAADRSLEALRAMGLRGGLETITDEGGGGLADGAVTLVIDMNDAGYPRVKFVNAPAGARDLRTFSPPGNDAKRAFFAQMNARLKGAEASARASGTTRVAQGTQGTQGTATGPRAPARSGPPRGFAPQHDDSDVPF